MPHSPSFLFFLRRRDLLHIPLSPRGITPRGVKGFLCFCYCKNQMMWSVLSVFPSQDEESYFLYFCHKRPFGYALRHINIFLIKVRKPSLHSGRVTYV